MLLPLSGVLPKGILAIKECSKPVHQTPTVYAIALGALVTSVTVGVIELSTYTLNKFVLLFIMVLGCYNIFSSYKTGVAFSAIKISYKENAYSFLAIQFCFSFAVFLVVLCCSQGFICMVTNKKIKLARAPYLKVTFPRG